MTVKKQKVLTDTSSNIFSVFLITAATLVVTYFHYGIPKHHTVIHLSHYYAFYLIVIYAAYRFSLKGGLIVSVILTIIYSPSAYLHMIHLDFSHHILPTIVEVSMVYAVALVAGLLSDRLKREKMKVEQVSKEMLEIERQMAHDDKLRVLGQLSAGIAHEIRNPLAAIKSGISMIKSGKANDKVTDILSEEIEQLNSFVDRFLQYARLGTGKKEKINLCIFMQELSELVKLASAGKKTNIQMHYNEECKTEIYIEKNAVKQALLNLTMNAVEAAEKSAQPKVDITAEVTEDNTIFTVQDNGEGIEEGDIKKIFEPFYTTKAEGTGLGLALAVKTASEHNGMLKADSKGAGTIFTLTLPKGAK